LTAATASFGVDRWRFHGHFAAARGGLTTLLSMMVMGALVVAFEAFEVLDDGMECMVSHVFTWFSSGLVCLRLE